LVSLLGIVALIYGSFSLTWTGPETTDIVMIFVMAIVGFAIGIMTYGGRIIIEEKILKIEFFFGLKKYVFDLAEIRSVTVYISRYKFTPLTIYQDGKIFPMPANQNFIDNVAKLQPVSGDNATH